MLNLPSHVSADVMLAKLSSQQAYCVGLSSRRSLLLVYMHASKSISTLLQHATGETELAVAAICYKKEDLNQLDDLRKNALTNAVIYVCALPWQHSLRVF